MNIFRLGKMGIFAGGVLFGTAGLKVLGSEDAKKAYTHVAAAVLRAKDCVMEQATRIQENAEDILADAKELNRARKAESSQEFEDLSGEEALNEEDV